MTEPLNPYQAPEGDLGHELHQEGEVSLFKPSTRIGRLRYLSRAFTFVAGSYILIGIAAALFMPIGGAIAALGGFISLALLLFIVVTTYIFGIQRLHDLNQSGWLILLNLVPFINLVLMIFLFFVPGTNGANKWGAKPPANTAKHWLGAFLPIILFGVLAVIALPAYQDYTQRAQNAQAVDWSE